MSYLAGLFIGTGVVIYVLQDDLGVLLATISILFGVVIALGLGGKGRC